MPDRKLFYAVWKDEMKPVGGRFVVTEVRVHYITPKAIPAFNGSAESTVCVTLPSRGSDHKVLSDWLKFERQKHKRCFRLEKVCRRPDCNCRILCGRC